MSDSGLLKPGPNPHIAKFMQRKAPPPFMKVRQVTKRSEEDSVTCYPKQDLQGTILLCAISPLCPALPTAVWRPHSRCLPALAGIT